VLSYVGNADVSPVSGREEAVFRDIISISTKVYFLVIGITTPLLYLRPYLEVGVTRGQFALGLSVAAVLLSLCFSLFYGLAFLALGGISPFDAFSNAIYTILPFFIGWVGVIGFQLRRLYAIILGLILANVFLQLTIRFATRDILFIPDLGQALIAIAMIAAMVFAIHRLSRHIGLGC
jgi:hypothetical protein